MPATRSYSRRPSTFGDINLTDLDFFGSNVALDSNSGHPIGVLVVSLPATAATSLLIGDAVFVASTGLLNKSTTVALYAGRVGIVCGGRNTDMKVVDDYASVGVLLAKSSTTQIEDVLVAVAGVYWGIADETMAAASAPVGHGAASTTAGRLKTTAPVAGRVFGIKLSLSTEAAGTAFPLLLALA